MMVATCRPRRKETEQEKQEKAKHVRAAVSAIESVSPWLNLTLGAAYAHRHPQTLMNEVKAGRLRAARIGQRREYFFLKEWIDDWMESQSTPVVIPLRRHG